MQKYKIFWILLNEYTKKYNQFCHIYNRMWITYNKKWPTKTPAIIYYNPDIQELARTFNSLDDHGSNLIRISS